MKKMRATTHNGRKGKDGVYSNKHNDRQFDLKNAPNIDPTKTKYNRYWYCYKHTKTEEETERVFYERHFTKGLNAQNERHKASRHLERCKTMEDYISSPNTCPEETIFQIGNADERSRVKPADLWSITAKQIEWEQKTFPNVRYMNATLHMDEVSMHMHTRKVWIYHDKDGNQMVGQAKALEEMGVEAPNPNKEKGRHNNAKQTYTRACREHFLALCKEYGYDIELTPKEASKVGLSLLEYKTQQEQEKYEQARRNLTIKTQEYEEVTKSLADVLKFKIGASEPVKKGIFAKKDTVEVDAKEYAEMVELTQSVLKHLEKHSEQGLDTQKEANLAYIEELKRRQLQATQEMERLKDEAEAEKKKYEAKSKNLDTEAERLAERKIKGIDKELLDFYDNQTDRRRDFMKSHANAKGVTYEEMFQEAEKERKANIHRGLSR